MEGESISACISLEVKEDVMKLESGGAAEE